MTDLVVDAETLDRAVSVVGSFVSKDKESVSSHVYLARDGHSTAVVVGTDGTETWARARVPCKWAWFGWVGSLPGAFAVAVRPRALRHALKLCHGGDVQIRTDPDDRTRVHMHGRQGFASLDGVDPKDFPARPHTPEPWVARPARVEGRVLARAIAKVAWACSPDVARIGLKDILLEDLGCGTVRFVGCDGHRIAVCDTDEMGGLRIPRRNRNSQLFWDEKGERPRQVLLARDAMVSVGKLARRAGLCSVQVSDDRAVFSFSGDVDILVRAELVQFLNYRKTLWNGLEIRTVMGREELLRVCRNMAPCLPDANRPYVHMKITKDGYVRLRVRKTFKDRHVGVDLSALEGKDVDVSVNVNYLIEALAAVDGDEVNLHFANDEERRVIRISPRTASDHWSILMPLSPGT